MTPANAPTRRTARTAGAARRPDAWRQPVLLWALVMMVAMMSFYVHLLNGQVQRAEGMRQSQRAAVADGKPTGATKAPASRPLRVSQNTAR